MVNHVDSVPSFAKIKSTIFFSILAICENLSAYGMSVMSITYLPGHYSRLQLLSVTLGFGIACDTVIWTNGIVWHSIKYATKWYHL